MDSDDVDIRKERAQAFLRETVEASDIFETLLISRPDGSLLAGFGKNTELNLMAAISTTILALADKLGNQPSEELVLESDASPLVLLNVAGMVLTLIGTPQSKVAMVLASGKRIAKQLNPMLAAKAEGVMP